MDLRRAASLQLCIALLKAKAFAAVASSLGCLANFCATKENRTHDPKNPNRLKN